MNPVPDTQLLIEHLDKAGTLLRAERPRDAMTVLLQLRKSGYSHPELNESIVGLHRGDAARHEEVARWIQDLLGSLLMDEGDLLESLDLHSEPSPPPSWPDEARLSADISVEDVFSSPLWDSAAESSVAVESAPLASGDDPWEDSVVEELPPALVHEAASQADSEPWTAEEEGFDAPSVPEHAPPVWEEPAIQAEGEGEDLEGDDLEDCVADEVAMVEEQGLE